jgi:PPOX class probable F420-dependent enzyme
MGVRIEGWAREVLERPGVFGTLSTLQPDGSPLQAVVWFELRGDDLLVNSAVGRHWPGNLQRDPRFSLLVEQGYEFVSIRGVAEALADPEQAQADIAGLARRYLAADPVAAERLIEDAFRTQQRISFLLHPRAVTERPA